MGGPEAVFVFIYNTSKRNEAGETNCDFPGLGGALNQ